MGNGQSQHQKPGGSPIGQQHRTQQLQPRTTANQSHRTISGGGGLNNNPSQGPPPTATRRSRLELPDLTSLTLGPREAHANSRQGGGTPFGSTTRLGPQSAPIPIPVPAGASGTAGRGGGHRDAGHEEEVYQDVRGGGQAVGGQGQVEGVAQGGQGGEYDRGRARSRERGRDRIHSRDDRRGGPRDRDRERERDRGDRPQPITPMHPPSEGTAEGSGVGREGEVLTFRPPLQPPAESLDYLRRYESRDGELRRRQPTGAERPRSKTPFKQEVIFSNAAIGMRKIEKQRRVEREGGERAKIPTTFTWKSPAKQVFVTGSFVDVPWRHTLKLTPINTTNLGSLPEGVEATTKEKKRESATSITTTSPSSATFLHEVTVPLSPGSHRLKFIVDDVYMCSEELPTATDNDGNLVNVLEVGTLRDGDVNDDGLSGVVESPSRPMTPDAPKIASPIAVPSGREGEPIGEIVGRNDGALSPGVDTSLPQNLTTHLNPPDQFWSSDEEYTDSSSASQLAKSPRSLPQSPQHRPPRKKPKKTSIWITQPPPELECAALLEEEFLANPNAPGAHGRILKLIPPAPHLPRFLDKVILNTKEGHEKSRHTYHASATGGSPSPSTSARGSPSGSRNAAGKSGRSRRHAHPPSPTPIPAYIATNTPMTLTVAPRLGQGAINTSEQGAGAGDDKSVLPVPSHVVLNHLATSAIKGGVLASASTVRYRKKFITMVYYTTPSSPLQGLMDKQREVQAQEEQLQWEQGTQ